MALDVTILGCGSSGGVPRVAFGWGSCDPQEPRNARTRCSVLLRRGVEPGRTTVLIDTSPDLRTQLLREEVGRLDAVLMTHDHADHTHGIDDLRPLVIAARRRIAVHAADDTAATLLARFSYCFEAQPGSEYPPILDLVPLSVDEPVTLNGRGGPIEAVPLPVWHGRGYRALGFRVGAFAYLPDVSEIPDETAANLEGLDALVLDALRYTPHPTHFSLAEALAWIKRLSPRRAWLTNLHTDLDYLQLSRELPPGVEPAFDGLSIRVGN